jgi:transposase InsO family protein
MDRGAGCLYNNIKDCPKILLAEHCLPLRSTSELTVDNGKQFDNQGFKDFCFSIGTKLAFASVYHPQSNGVVERANGKIFTAVKKMLLDERKGRWTDLLPEAVWALNTTECRATGFT